MLMLWRWHLRPFNLFIKKEQQPNRSFYSTRVSLSGKKNQPMASTCPFKLLGLPLSASLEEIDEKCEELRLKYRASPDIVQKLRDARVQAAVKRGTVVCSAAKELRIDEEIKQIKSLPKDVRFANAEMHAILAKKHEAMSRRYRLRFAPEFSYFVETRLWKPEHERAADRVFEYGMGDSRVKFLEERALKWEALHETHALRAQLLSVGLQPLSGPSSAADAAQKSYEMVRQIDELKLSLSASENTVARLTQLVGLLQRDKEVWMQEKVEIIAKNKSLQSAVDTRDNEQFLREYKERQAQRKAAPIPSKPVVLVPNEKPTGNQTAKELTNNLVNHARTAMRVDLAADSVCDPHFETKADKDSASSGVGSGVPERESAIIDALIRRAEEDANVVWTADAVRDAFDAPRGGKAVAGSPSGVEAAAKSNASGDSEHREAVDVGAGSGYQFPTLSDDEVKTAMMYAPKPPKHLDVGTYHVMFMRSVANPKNARSTLNDPRAVMQIRVVDGDCPGFYKSMVCAAEKLAEDMAKGLSISTEAGVKQSTANGSVKPQTKKAGSMDGSGKATYAEFIASE
jgi:hypothetical protein